MTNDLITKPLLRKQLRATRNALSNTQRRENERAISSILLESPAFANAQHIALYLSNDGEPSLREFFDAAISAGKSCYLPCVEGKNMIFRHYTRETKLRENRFGILEPPETAAHIAVEELDVVCMPVVAYDLEGGRLGMGGGFYDRCFAFKRKDSQVSPILIGVAHSVQQVRAVPLERFDVRLDAVASEVGLEARYLVNA